MAILSELFLTTAIKCNVFNGNAVLSSTPHTAQHRTRRTWRSGKLPSLYTVVQCVLTSTHATDMALTQPRPRPATSFSIIVETHHLVSSDTDKLRK
jgi:hypothetical protein